MFKASFTKYLPNIWSHIANPSISNALLLGLIWGLLSHVNFLLAGAVSILCVYLIFVNSEKKIYGFATYSAYMSMVLSFMFSYYPIDWIRIPDFTSLLLIVVAWTFSSACIALSVPVVLVIYNKLNTPQTPFFMASGWVAVEILGPFAYYLSSWSTESYFGSHYTFGLIGYSQADAPWMAGLAMIGGVHLVGWFTLLLGLYFLHYIIKNYPKRIGPFTVLVSITLAFFILLPTFYDNLNPPKKYIDVVASRIDYSNYQAYSHIGKSTQHKEIGEEIKKILSLHPNTDLMVLPEGVGFLNSLQDLEINLPQNTSFIDSAQKQKNRGVVAQIQSYDPNYGYRDGQEKLLLSPGGEFLPWYVSLGLKIFDPEQFDYIYQSDHVLVPGKDIIVHEFDDFTPGVSLCSELFSPWRIAQSASGSQFIVNLSSHASLRGDIRAEIQTRQVAQIRAAENHQYLVRSSSQSPTIIVSPNGVVISDQGNDGYTISTIGLYDSKTIFNQYPYGFIIILFIILIARLSWRKKTLI